MIIRSYRPEDLEAMKRITAEVFAEAAIDQFLEKRHGLVGGHDWRWRKLRHIDADIETNPDGVFVGEEEGDVLGYVTVTLDRGASIGRIPNIAVGAAAQGKGAGRKLLDRAIEYMRAEGMEMAKIETLAGNGTGEHLYPSMGFEEISRQIHFFKKL